MTHRLFVALPVPEDISERLLPLRTDVFGARWRRLEHFHITLCFYGEVSHDIAYELADALEKVQGSALQLEVDGVGWFGRREPRALYARIKANEALAALAADCRQIARQLGLKLGQEPFLPHITLAYCHNTPLESAMAWSEDFQILTSEPFLVDAFCLYESFTGHKRQSRYVPQAEYRLF